MVNESNPKRDEFSPEGVDGDEIRPERLRMIQPGSFGGVIS